MRFDKEMGAAHEIDDMWTGRNKMLYGGISREENLFLEERQ